MHGSLVLLLIEWFYCLFLRVIRENKPPISSATLQRVAPTKVNHIGALPLFSYHYISTLPDKWQVVSPSGRLDLPIDPTIPSPNEHVTDQYHPYVAPRKPKCM